MSKWLLLAVVGTRPMKSECCNSSHQCPLKYYTNFYWKSTKVHSSTAPNNQCTTTTTTTTTHRWVQNTRQCSREAKHLFSPQVWNHGRSQDLTHSTHTVLCGQHVCSPSPPKQLGDLVTKACLYAVDDSLCGWNVLSCNQLFDWSILLRICSLRSIR